MDTEGQIKSCQAQRCCNERACEILGQCVFFHDHFKGIFFEIEKRIKPRMKIKNLNSLLNEFATRRFILPGGVYKGRYVPLIVPAKKDTIWKMKNKYPQRLQPKGDGTMPHTNTKDKHGKSAHQEWLDQMAILDQQNGYAYSNTHKHINFHEPE
jgi:hypothetical protein